MDLAATDRLLFWLIALAMTGAALGFLLPRLLARGAPRAAGGRSPTQANLDVYRRRIAELEGELAAGALTEAECREAKADLERRLLADGDTAAEAECATHEPRAAPGLAIALGVALPVLAFGLYALFGDPTALSGAPTEAATPASLAEGDPAALREKLAAHLERAPRDGRAWVLLARLDFAADRFPDAAAAYAKALDVSPKVGRDPDVWCEYADALGMAQGGSLAGRPRELVAHALTLDAKHPKALEMAGSAAFDQGDPRRAAGYWRELLAQMPADSAERRELAAAVARAEQLASLPSAASTVTR